MKEQVPTETESDVKVKTKHSISNIPDVSFLMLQVKKLKCKSSVKKDEFEMAKALHSMAHDMLWAKIREKFPEVANGSWSIDPESFIISKEEEDDGEKGEGEKSGEDYDMLDPSMPAKERAMLAIKKLQELQEVLKKASEKV